MATSQTKIARRKRATRTPSLNPVTLTIMSLTRAWILEIEVRIGKNGIWLPDSISLMVPGLVIDFSHGSMLNPRATSTAMLFPPPPPFTSFSQRSGQTPMDTSTLKAALQLTGRGHLG